MMYRFSWLTRYKNTITIYTCCDGTPCTFTTFKTLISRLKWYLACYWQYIPTYISTSESDICICICLKYWCLQNFAKGDCTHMVFTSGLQKKGKTDKVRFLKESISPKKLAKTAPQFLVNKSDIKSSLTLSSVYKSSEDLQVFYIFFRNNWNF